MNSTDLALPLLRSPGQEKAKSASYKFLVKYHWGPFVLVFGLTGHYLIRMVRSGGFDFSMKIPFLPDLLLLTTLYYTYHTIKGFLVPFPNNYQKQKRSQENQERFYGQEKARQQRLLKREQEMAKFSPSPKRSLLGASSRIAQANRQEEDPMEREPSRLHRLIILIWRDGVSEETLWKSCRQKLLLKEAFPNIQLEIVVLSEDPIQGSETGTVPFVGVKLISIQHTTPSPKSDHKARALEFYRLQAKLQDEDWVLHLNGGSEVNVFTIQSVLDFINNTAFDVGQGIVLSDQSHLPLYKDILTRTASHFGVGNQLGLLHYQFGALHYPKFGCHGDFFLTNGKVENDVTWNHASPIVDFIFSLEAGRKGYRFGQIAGFCRVEGCKSLSDLLRVRRKWFLGVWMSGESISMRCLFVWVSGFLCLLYGLLRVFVGPEDYCWWISLVSWIHVATIQAVYVWGAILESRGYQDEEPWVKVLVVITWTIFMYPISLLFEFLIFMWVVVTGPRELKKLRNPMS